MSDIVLVHPGGVHGIQPVGLDPVYGALGQRLTAFEQPLWVRLIAGYLVDRQWSVRIVDQEALSLTPAQVAKACADARIVAVVANGHQPSASTQSMPAAYAIVRALKDADDPDRLVVVLGNHASALPERTLTESGADYVVDGEGPVTLDRLLSGADVDGIPGLVRSRLIPRDLIQHNPPAPLLDLDRDLHGDAWDLLPPFNRYRAHNWQCLDGTPRSPYAAVYTSLGCPYKCLAGDTPVNTIYGNIPIRELVGREFPVFTFDPETRDGKVSTARNVRSYGQSRLVRVHFDDGTHIDCTPDHQFLQFKVSGGPGSPEAVQYVTEAKDMLPRSRVRALRFNHRVVSVEELPGLHEVYCLEVPETGWFYANNVLVKNCSFCMINTFQHANRYRRRSPKRVADEIARLHHEHGVRAFKIIDELFVLNQDHYLGVVNRLAAHGLGDEVNIWCYARPDTVTPDDLPALRRGGIRWLALGIESGADAVRTLARKGLRRGGDNGGIVDMVAAIRAAGISVIANYIFGLPGDTLETMAATLALAQELNTEWANFYSIMAYPGSPLYDEVARDRPLDLPPTWAAYSQHNRHSHPLRNEHLIAADILGFRDYAFDTYFSSDRYLGMLDGRFGSGAVEEVRSMLAFRLERDLLR